MKFRVVLLAFLAFSLPACKKSSSTGPDPVVPLAPVQVQVTPGQGSEGVVVESSVQVSFSRAVDPSTVNAGAIVLARGTFKADSDPPFSQVKGTVSAGESSATFSPAGILDEDTIYSVRVSGSIRDREGNPIGEDVEVSFKTLDTIAPAVVRTSPADLAVNLLPDTDFLFFLDEVDPSQLQPDWIEVFEGGNPDPLTGAIQAGSNFIAFDPDQDLQENTAYTATLTTKVVDEAGNALAAPFSIQVFSKDSVSPVLLGSTPADGSVGVDSMVGQIQVDFSESLFSAANSDFFLQRLDNGKGVPFQVQYTPGTSQVQVGFTNPLHPHVNYQLDIHNSLFDRAGNPFAGDVLEFTTDHFTSPEEIDRAPEVATNPVFLMNDTGRGYVVFQQKREGDQNRNVYFTQYNFFGGKGWRSDAVRISFDAGNASSHRMILDSNKLYVWWLEPDASNAQQMMYVVGTIQGGNVNWTIPVAITTSSRGVSQAVFQAHGNSKLVAVWMEQAQGDSNFNLYGSHTTNNGWSSPTRLSDDKGGVTQPILNRVSNGSDINLIWQEKSKPVDSFNNVYFRRFRGTNWGSAQVRVSSDGGNTSAHDIASVRVGNRDRAFVVWAQNNTIRAAEVLNGTVQPETTIESQSSRRPRISARGGDPDSVHVVWENTSGPFNDIGFVGWNDFIGGWGTKRLINDPGTDGFSPMISVDAKNRALVVWSDGFNLIGYYNQATPILRQLTDNTTLAARSPSVSMNGDNSNPRGGVVFSQDLPKSGKDIVGITFQP